ncbi:MAG: type II toxin-antitoxin system RelE/ParE family toxin [Dehalococcoidia bacterium]
MVWVVEYTDEFGAWWNTLSEDEQIRVAAAVDVLEVHGPALGRPFVESIHASRHPNMKELRPRGGNLRGLFAFDPRRTALPLIGGDKTNRWQAWYARFIPIADRLYDDHLATLAREEQQP